MPRLTDTAPPRILDVDAEILSFDPKVGVLLLETDDGPLKFAINRNVAALLASMMVDFLASEEGDEDEAANDD